MDYDRYEWDNKRSADALGITIEFVEVQTTPSFFIDVSQGSVECCQVFLDVLIVNKHCVLCGCPAAVIW